MGKIYIFIFLIITVSCNKILDVKPADQILDDQVFSTKLGIENTLNGFYLSIVSGEAMYGGNMSMTMIDILAQYYNLNQTENIFYQTSLYNYTDNNFVSYSNTYWNGAYNIIFQNNVFIKKLNESTAVDTAEKQILLGESYGLRAFLMLDLLRFYGPIYSIDSNKLSIPINHNVVALKESNSPANIVLNSIISDIDTSLYYLKNDPVITNGVDSSTTINGDNFLSMRNRRFNYYAAKALLARAYMYQGNRSAALNVAKQLISESSKWFPFSSPLLSLPGLSSPDRNFSSEIIFGVLNPKLYNIQTNYFASSLLAQSILIPTDYNLNSIYESNTNDYRFRVNWLLDATTSRTTKTFYKYADVVDKTASFRYLQPLIRMSEMYYIVAECTDDIQEASNYLNMPRNYRGLLNVTITTNNLRTEITKEYKKEFWGEGQLFFYYKRLNFSSISSGTTQGENVNMDVNKYVVPLPQSETNYQ